MKARAVFQGNDTRTKAGKSPIRCFKDTANTPASLLAIRCGLAAATLRRLMASVRDAGQAFLQADIDDGPNVVTLAELSNIGWPIEWYDDKLRKYQKCRRPVAVLRRALYGHPRSGFLWEAKLIGVAYELGWKFVGGWCCALFLHMSMHLLLLYAFMMY